MGALVPSSGNLHPIGLPAAGVPTGTVGGTETIDPAGNRFFFSGTPNGGVAKVYSLSTIHGAVLAGLRPRSALRRRLRRRQHQRLVGHRPLVPQGRQVAGSSQRSRSAASAARSNGLAR